MGRRKSWTKRCQNLYTPNEQYWIGLNWVRKNYYLVLTPHDLRITSLFFFKYILYTICNNGRNLIYITAHLIWITPDSRGAILNYYYDYYCYYYYYTRGQLYWQETINCEILMPAKYLLLKSVSRDGRHIGLWRLPSGTPPPLIYRNIQ